LKLPMRVGAQKMELVQGVRKIAVYDAAELSEFRTIKPANDPLISEIDVILEIVGPIFEGEAVWRFKLGRMKLTAKIVDDDYRQQVSDGHESFRRGDGL